MTAHGRAPRQRHYHCKVFVYRTIDDKQFADSVEFDLKADDPREAIARAQTMAEDSTNDEAIVRRKWTLRYARECDLSEPHSA